MATTKKAKKAKKQIANANVNINIRDFTTKRRSPVRRSYYGGFSQAMSQFRNITPESNSVLFEKVKAKQTQAFNNFSRDLRTELTNINVDILTKQHLNKKGIDDLTHENEKLKFELSNLQTDTENLNSSVKRLNTRFTNKTIKQMMMEAINILRGNNSAAEMTVKLEEIFKDEDQGK